MSNLRHRKHLSDADFIICRYAATATTKSGEYICPPADPESGSALAEDDDLAEQMMKLTGEIIKEKIGSDLEFY